MKKGVIKKIRVVYLFALFLSCSRSDNDLTSIVTVKCYWDIVRKDSSVKYCYKFNSDGSCNYFYYDSKNNRSEFYDDDNIKPKSWIVANDSTFIFRGLERKVLFFNADSILLKNITNNENTLLIKNCN